MLLQVAGEFMLTNNLIACMSSFSKEDGREEQSRKELDLVVFC